MINYEANKKIDTVINKSEVEKQLSDFEVGINEIKKKLDSSGNDDMIKLGYQFQLLRLKIADFQKTLSQTEEINANADFINNEFQKIIDAYESLNKNINSIINKPNDEDSAGAYFANKEEPEQESYKVNTGFIPASETKSEGDVEKISEEKKESIIIKLIDNKKSGIYVVNSGEEFFVYNQIYNDIIKNDTGEYDNEFIEYTRKQIALNICIKHYRDKLKVEEELQVLKKIETEKEGLIEKLHKMGLDDMNIEENESENSIIEKISVAIEKRNYYLSLHKRSKNNDDYLTAKKWNDKLNELRGAEAYKEVIKQINTNEANKEKKIDLDKLIIDPDEKFEIEEGENIEEIRGIANDVYNKRINNEEEYSWEKIDELLKKQDPPIEPNTEEAALFMEKWDWQQAEKIYKEKTKIIEDKELDSWIKENYKQLLEDEILELRQGLLSGDKELADRFEKDNQFKHDSAEGIGAREEWFEKISIMNIKERIYNLFEEKRPERTEEIEEEKLILRQEGIKNEKFLQYLKMMGLEENSPEANSLFNEWVNNEAENIVRKRVIKSDNPVSNKDKDATAEKETSDKEEKIPEIVEIEKEIEKMPEPEKKKLGIGLATIGFYVEEQKNKFFEKMFKKFIGSKTDIQEKGTFKRFIYSLGNTYGKEAKTAREKIDEINKIKDEGQKTKTFGHKFKNTGYLVGNITKYGRSIADLTGYTVASPFRWVIIGGMFGTKLADSFKEARLANANVIEKTRLDENEAAEKAWELYEKAKKNNKTANKEDLNKAYLQSIPEDLRARLEKSENVSDLTQRILRNDIKSCLKKVEKKINKINNDNKLSEEQKDAQKQIVYSSYKDYLNDYDRIISQAGTVDACAMAAKYAQYAGKTTVAALTVETLGLSIRGIIDNLPKIIESDSYNKFLEMIGSKKFVNIRQLFENSVSELDPEVKKELLANLKIEDLNKDGSINSKDISYKQFKVLTDENGKLDVTKIKWMAERAENKVKFNGFKQVIAGLSEENRQKVMDQLGISDINEIKQNNFKILEERLAAVRNASGMSDKMLADIDKAGLIMGKIPSEWKVGVGENLDKILGKVATNNNLFNSLSGNEDEIIAKKTFIINALEKKIAADPGKYGLSNIHELRPGQTIKLEGVFDEQELSRITDKANALSDEQIKNILKNNKAISDWVKEHPGQKLTQADGKAGEILGNKPKIINHENTGTAKIDNLETSKTDVNINKDNVVADNQARPIMTPEEAQDEIRKSQEREKNYDQAKTSKGLNENLIDKKDLANSQNIASKLMSDENNLAREYNEVKIKFVDHNKPLDEYVSKNYNDKNKVFEEIKTRIENGKLDKKVFAKHYASFMENKIQSSKPDIIRESYERIVNIFNDRRQLIKPEELRKVVKELCDSKNN